jgi:uncharacterized DUF497 family protein
MVDLAERSWNALPVRVAGFEWDDGNALHLALGHGIAAEAEEVLAVAPIVRRTKRGHYAAFGPTLAGRLLVIVFERKPKGLVRVITGWDMKRSEQRYWRRQRRGTR